MSGVEIISSDQDIWEKIENQELKDDWAVQQAAQSGFVQAPLSVFVKFGYKDSTVEEIIEGDLAETLVNSWEVPFDRVPEVFAKARYLIQQRMEVDGEA